METARTAATKTRVRVRTHMMKKTMSIKKQINLSLLTAQRSNQPSLCWSAATATCDRWMILLPFSIPYPLLTSKRVLYEYVDSLLALRTPREPVCSPVPLHRGYCTQYITVRTLREKPTYRYQVSVGEPQT